MEPVSIINKVVEGIALDDSEIDFLRTFSNNLSQSPPMEDFENLKNSINELTQERDLLQKNLNEMSFEKEIDLLANEYNFTDRDYLSFLCQKNNYSPSDKTNTEEFMNKIRDTHPRFFKCHIKSGSLNEVNPNSKHSQEDVLSIQDLIGQAPEIL